MKLCRRRVALLGRRWYLPDCCYIHARLDYCWNRNQECFFSGW